MTNYRKRVTLPSLGSVSINFYCIASSIFELYEKTDEFERQKSINHLGLISTQIDGASHTRYDYLMLLCALTDILDRLHKGSLAQGSLKVNSQTFQGNGILKAWFLLSNFGHLKNTFGDERTLIQYAIEKQGFKSRLLNPIRSPNLKSWCEGVIDNFEYHKFHYVLAIYRIYKEQVRLLDKQDQMAMIMELLLVELDRLSCKVNASKLIQLRNLFRKIRDIAIVTIDGHYSHTPVSIDLTSSLVSFDEIEGGVFGKDISYSLSPIKQLLSEEIYLNPNVLANQRSYEVTALAEISKLPSTPEGYDSIIEKAIKNGLLANHRRNLRPFCRISSQTAPDTSTSLLEEFKNLANKVKSNCTNADVYLDANPYTNVQHADFFISDDFCDTELPRLLFSISSLIKDQIDSTRQNTIKNILEILPEIREVAASKGLAEGLIDEIIQDSTNFMTNYRIWDSDRIHMFPQFRRLLWSVISYFIKDQYRIEIEESESPYQSHVFSYAELGNELLLRTLDRAIVHEGNPDPDRAHELQMLKQLAKRKFNGIKIACLARVKILDMTKPPEQMITTDIDAVLLTISTDTFRLELLEAKNKKRQRESAATKDLRGRLVPVLNGRGSYRIKPVKGFGAKLVLSCGKKAMS